MDLLKNHRSHEKFLFCCQLAIAFV